MWVETYRLHDSRGLESIPPVLCRYDRTAQDKAVIGGDCMGANVHGSIQHVH